MAGVRPLTTADEGILQRLGQGSDPDLDTFSHRALDHQLLDLGNRLGRVEPLGAGLGAVQDGVAAVEAERVLQIVQPLALGLVAAVAQPAVGLQQGRGPEIVRLVPPVARAGGRATGAEDAFVEAVELLAVFLGLAVLTALDWVLVCYAINREVMCNIRPRVRCRAGGRAG